VNRILNDLFAHQFWADAELWIAIGAHAPAREDKVIHDRLHHIHQVQRAFVWNVRADGAPFALSKPQEFPTHEDLRRYAREIHGEIHSLLESISDARLEEPLTVPWFRDPPLTISVTEALTQSTMHSHYHRGQNATRLRELGGVPPLTDLIVWYWKGRPSANW
jgi:uncharacterized damage-inducible protein DinB